MGYETTFTGHVAVTPPLSPHEIDYLERFAGTRHDHRTNGLPGYWCKWIPSADGSTIQWSHAEKFYDADKWMAYLIDTFLRPGATATPEPEFTHFTFDHVVNGTIDAEGEYPEDKWRLEVRDNTVYVIHLTVQPGYDEIDPRELGEWGDDEWARFTAMTRHNIAFLVRDGELHEVGPADGSTFNPVST